MPQTVTNPLLAEFLDSGGRRNRGYAGYAGSSRQTMTSVLCRWERWCAAHGSELHHGDAELFRNYLKARQDGSGGYGHAGPSTLHKDWQTIDAFYAYLARPVAYDRRQRAGAGMLDRNPMLEVAAPFVPQVLPNRRYVHGTDVEPMFAYFNKLAARRKVDSGEFVRARRNAAVLAMLVSTGMRIGEVRWLDVEHLVAEDGVFVAVFIGGEDGTRTKTGKGRYSMIDDRADYYLRRYLRWRHMDPGPLFIGRQAHTKDASGRMLTGAFSEGLKRAAKRCELRVSPHDLRRGWTETLNDAGVLPDDIKRMAGWEPDHDDSFARYSGRSASLNAVRRAREVLKRSSG